MLWPTYFCNYIIYLPHMNNKQVKNLQTTKCLCGWKIFWIILLSDWLTLAPHVWITLPKIKFPTPPFHLAWSLPQSFLLLIERESNDLESSYIQAHNPAFFFFTFFFEDILSTSRETSSSAFTSTSYLISLLSSLISSIIFFLHSLN